MAPDFPVRAVLKGNTGVSNRPMVKSAALAAQSTQRPCPTELLTQAKSHARAIQLHFTQSPHIFIHTLIHAINKKQCTGFVKTTSGHWKAASVAACRPILQPTSATPRRKKASTKQGKNAPELEIQKPVFKPIKGLAGGIGKA
ncbi:hypothetical protein [uncultured Roseobacter sp.]|uniref:hypothetical protein n=1 Tax=uncultured Roseobacter sp. TaxID=114847 RepID=UPI00260B9325|nr:hypothetical protein [uncultured Roseobacter sp.]